ncbi:TIGR02117 family protein [Jannaschia pohangensis]|nr:TIGR02117 family protein [Jannaschia pohangensis]
MRQRLLSLVVALPVLILLWFLAGLIGAVIPSGEAPEGTARTVEIRLVAAPLHYDVLLPPTPETLAMLAFAEDAGLPLSDPSTGWILVGWGAREFYISSAAYADMEVGATLRAISGDASVLRVEPWPDFDPGMAGAGAKVLHVTPDGYAALLAGIAGSTTGEVIRGAGLSDRDRFFDGTGRFNILRTCNVWVGEMLRAAGLRFGSWTPTPQAVRLALSLYVE